MKKLFLLAVLAVMCIGAGAQRSTDNLDRGLVAVKTGSGVYCSWRVLGEEYYDVTYNLYRNGTRIASGLTVSNYSDTSGSTSSSYTVSAVVRGVEQQQNKAVKPWTNNNKEIVMNHGSLTSTYVPNDACCADVDGDGEVEILLKFDNLSEINASYPRNGYNGEYSIMEVYKLNGTKLWWLDFGPNMGDFQNNEQNIVAYDWDMDGKAEAVMRAADGTTIHASNGQTYVIGDATKNYRAATGGGSNWFMHEGAEYLVYMEGATGIPYVTMDYPLKRLENGETSLEAAWGDGYGHRSTKHFFGAPYLDGRRPSIFLARGIYTRHKMIAYNVNPQTHQLTERWRWNCSDGSSPYFGQGYHNYAVADVDWDGRDEILFGSMVIDDNGKGLSTTGFGHGDAEHVSDLNPYAHGQEVFACMEDNPGTNYRDATTSKIYYRYVAARDVGRCMAGNFSNEFPGAMGTPTDKGPISLVTANTVSNISESGVTQNFRIYWDGDLCEESFDYVNGKNTAGGIFKYKQGLIETLSGSLTNNDTKGTPCYQGDILGDWREEVIMRTSTNNIRIYTTKTPTTWRNYTLWHDHQYRNAMVWQMCGYNQPPHTSYFLGELEGITQAPPALTMTGRTEVGNGGTISHNDQTVITCETGNMTVSVANGATPYLYIDNTPSWVQGTGSTVTNGNPNITRTYYTHTLTGGAFAGSMRLVKQGDGTLVLPAVTQTYSGNTDVWAGTLKFDGTLQNSPLWLNRHTKLISNGGIFAQGIQADYNATICPGGEGTVGTISTTTLTLNFGSRLVLDFSNGQCDQFTASTLVIEKKIWPNGGGPTYSTPVLQLSGDVAPGDYVLGNIGTIEGSIDDLLLEGPSDRKLTMTFEEGQLKLNVQAYEGGILTWTGANGNAWDLDNTQNFIDAEGQPAVFVPGSKVTFDDTAVNTAVSVKDNIAPKDIVFNNSRTYTIFTNSILGEPTLTKNGTGKTQLQNTNQMGNTTINEGTITVSSLANNSGTEYGSLGNVSKRITINNGATLALASGKSATSGQPILVGQGGAAIEVPSGQTLTQQGNIAGSGQTLTKKGTGTLATPASIGVKRLVIQGGTVQATENNSITSLPDTVEFQSGTLRDPVDIYSYTTNNANFIVPQGKTGTFYADSRCNYKGKLLGEGTFKVYATSVRGYFQGNWSGFEGTLEANTTKSDSYDPQFIFDNSYGLPKATLRISSGVTFDNNGKSMSIGSVTGTGTLGGSGGTYTIGGNDKNMTVNFSSVLPIVKVGEGIMIVNTPGKLTKTVTVRAGGLHFDTGDTDANLFGGVLTAEGTSEIVGNGKLASLIMKSGTQLTPRSTTLEDTFGGLFPGKVKSSASMSFNDGSTLNIVINSTDDYSTLEPAYLTMNGTVTATLSSSYTPNVGDTFTIWTAKSSFSGTPQLDLPALPLGLGWDTSGLADKTGVLSIVAVSVDVDVNGDGELTNADVAAVISAIAGTASAEVTARADINHDGKVNIADVTAVIRLLQAQ